MSKEPIIPKETAEEQLNLFLDFYEIEIEEEEDEQLSPEEEKEAADKIKEMKAIKRRLLKAIMYGRLEVKEAPEDVEVIQHLSRNTKGASDGGTKLHWEGISGVAKSSITAEASMTTMYKLCAGLTKVTPSTIMALRNLDLSTAEALAQLFLLM